MAEKIEKWPENVAGKYYIDTGCDGCELCNEEAPNNIKLAEDGEYSYVYKQPENEEEEAAMAEAMESCPTESIHDDGK